MAINSLNRIGQPCGVRQELTSSALRSGAYTHVNVALTPGTRLGVYEISALLGEGGMGHVYRATDTTLTRQVAIKILPDAFAADPERMARFKREAKTLAALNHPHIAAIYGFEKSGGAYALVMELVEGDDLSQRIAKGASPLDETLPIAKQIADALEAAHEQGIIHRDLKPANIKVRTDGTVKLLDFGLAKAVEPVSATSEVVSESPTITAPAMTQAGVVLGTAAYMSPEQARGRPVDKRADIWAFGCVLYEMLTGQHAFGGATISDTLAAILTRHPDWSLLPSVTPSRLRGLLGDCLIRDPKQRLRDIGDARIAIDRLLGAAPDDTPTMSAPPVRSASFWRRAFPWAAAATAGAVAGSLLVLWAPWRMPPSPWPLRLTADIGADASLVVNAAPAAILSPDGTDPGVSGLGRRRASEDLRTQTGPVAGDCTLRHGRCIQSLLFP